MPQLDTIYMFLVFSWTWFTTYLIIKKVKTFLMVSKKKNQQIKHSVFLFTLPWT